MLAKLLEGAYTSGTGTLQLRASLRQSLLQKLYTHQTHLCLSVRLLQFLLSLNLHQPVACYLTLGRLGLPGFGGRVL